ncbi:hypothetical protein SDRG_09768 [Saprolegnia diclina VS20]|uniref:Uncharacterized protein n=1 Tax=Saprolegnia diclina (strain VS20) TaxID=1156394 RepID=T0QFS9_SAPDV|nr:hypothetical protein SDRG_09768 [Saprolegnia diclina VS20]EQC32440.1 hypothetical protein SDRG_09768 [Saprolegnia diclina VS20]|eukprot:XP_008613941.1 hypothetical protein SDRG_09768 [Saprolegnia diclina VS20]
MTEAKRARAATPPWQLSPIVHEVITSMDAPMDTLLDNPRYWDGLWPIAGVEALHRMDAATVTKALRMVKVVDGDEERGVDLARFT